MIEVELKYPVDSLMAVREYFVELGATSQKTLIQSDEYLNDPLRDFEQMDLALRVRSCNGQFCLTFKGPNLDATAKIRKEIEMPLMDADAAQQIKQVFLGIGFVSVAKVEKQREELVLNWKEIPTHVCLDDVKEVGQFVELELVVEDASQVQEAKQQLVELAHEAGLAGATRTSYLELLLKKRGMI